MQSCLSARMRIILQAVRIQRFDAPHRCRAGARTPYHSTTAYMWVVQLLQSTLCLCGWSLHEPWCCQMWLISIFLLIASLLLNGAMLYGRTCIRSCRKAVVTYLNGTFYANLDVVCFVFRLGCVEPVTGEKITLQCMHLCCVTAPLGRYFTSICFLDAQTARWAEGTSRITACTRRAIYVSMIRNNWTASVGWLKVVLEPSTSHVCGYNNVDCDIYCTDYCCWHGNAWC